MLTAKERRHMIKFCKWNGGPTKNGRLVSPELMMYKHYTGTWHVKAAWRYAFSDSFKKGNVFPGSVYDNAPIVSGSYIQFDLEYEYLMTGEYKNEIR